MEAAYPKRIKVRTMSDEQREAARSWFQLAVNVGATLAMAITGWSFHQTMQLRSDMDTIKASRFSASDGLEIWKEIAGIKQTMAVLPVRADIAAIEKKQGEIGERLIRIEAAVVKDN